MVLSYLCVYIYILLVCLVTLCVLHRLYSVEYEDDCFLVCLTTLFQLHSSYSVQWEDDCFAVYLTLLSQLHSLYGVEWEDASEWSVEKRVVGRGRTEIRARYFPNTK
jgi:hypothetical protein